MPSQDSKTETRAGLFVLIGLLMLGALIVQFGRFGDRFKGQYPLVIEFPDTAGLIKGSEVKLRGAKVGRVASKPELTGHGTVSMELRIVDKIKVPRGSAFTIVSSGLLGDKYIQISPPAGEVDEYFAPGEKLMGVGAGGFDAIQSDAESVARDARTLMENAKTTLMKIDGALDDIRDVAGQLNVSMEKVNGGVLSDENLDSFRTAMVNLEEASEEMKASSQELQPTFREAREAIANVNDAVDGAKAMFASANQQIANVEPALNELPEAIRSIKNTAQAAEETMEQLKSDDGLIGTLVYDQEVKTDTKVFLNNLRRHGILGYKDDETSAENDPRLKPQGRRR